MCFEISSFTECHVSVGLVLGLFFYSSAVFVWQNHGLNLALPCHRQYRTNPNISLLQYIPQIQLLVGLQKSVQSRRKTCSRHRWKKEFHRVTGRHTHREMTQAPVPISTCAPVNARMAAAATWKAATKYMIRSCFSQPGPGFPFLQTQRLFLPLTSGSIKLIFCLLY